MAVRITISVIVLLGLLLVTDAENVDFLSPVEGHCRYLDACANYNSYEYCMTNCVNHGYNSAGAKCVPRETGRSCCCIGGKNSGSNSDSCHYVGECGHNTNECMAICADNGYNSGALCVQRATYNCCCLLDKKSGTFP